MSRSLKNTFMIIIISVLLLSSILTIFNEINLSKDNSPSFGMHQSYYNFSSRQLPNYDDFGDLMPTPQSSNDDIQEFKNTYNFGQYDKDSRYGSDKNEFKSFNIKKESNRTISIPTVIILLINSIGIAITLMYIVVSRFNKYTYKKTFDDASNIAIFASCSSVITLFLVIIEVVITNVLL